MKFLFVMDPLHTIHPDKDSTFMMMLETLRRGFECWYCQPHQLAVEGARPKALAQPVIVRRGTPFFEFIGEPHSLWLDECDTIHMRKDPPFDRAYLFATYILDLAVGKALVVNDPVGVKLANEKMYALNFQGLIPDTMVSNSAEELLRWLDVVGGKMVLKPWDQAGGAGIYVVTPDDRNLYSLLETATSFGKQYTIAQRYIPEVRQGDKRILLVDGEPVGAVLRVPKRDETRSNLHVGGQGVKTSLTTRDVEICQTLAPSLRRDGLFFVGIDVIGDFLTEVNVTSPTGIQEVNTLEGVALEKIWMDRLLTRLSRGERQLRSV